MRPTPESANAEHHEDDAWFAAESAGTGAGRERRARWALGALIVLMLLAAWGLGVFSGNPEPRGPDVARLRARAKAAATTSPLSAEGNAALLAGLDRLLDKLPAAPPPEVDAGTSGDAPGPAADDGASNTGGVDDGSGAVAATAPTDLVTAPRELPTQRPEPVVAVTPTPKQPEVEARSEGEPGKVEPKKEARRDAPKQDEPEKAATKKGEPRRDEGDPPKKTEPARKADAPASEPEKAEAKAEPAPVEAAPLDAKSKASVDTALAEAKTHLDAGRWNEARAGYERVLKASPGNPRALLGRGRALIELRQVQPALKDLKAVLDAEPKNPTALLLAGTISQELGQREQARGYYQRYLEAWPSGRKAGEVKALLERL